MRDKTRRQEDIKYVKINKSLIFNYYLTKLSILIFYWNSSKILSKSVCVSVWLICVFSQDLQAPMGMLQSVSQIKDLVWVSVETVVSSCDQAVWVCILDSPRSEDSISLQVWVHVLLYNNCSMLSRLSVVWVSIFELKVNDLDKDSG